MLNSITILFICVTIIALPGRSAPYSLFGSPSDHTLPAERDRLLPLLGQLANQTKFSGLMAARGPTLQDSDILASLGYGYSDVRGTVPNDPNTTRFPIASNTKLMTCIMILMLQERGILNVTDNVSKYLKASDFVNWGLASSTKFCLSLPSDPLKACQAITFEMLMGMTAGITGPAPQVLLGFAPMYVNIAYMFGLQFPLMTLAFKPGTQYLYSNQNYMLLGYFIEKYTGMELGAAYKRYIFDPLGMKDTYFDRLNGLLMFDPLRTQEGFRYFMVDQESETVGAPLGVGKCEIDADTGTAQGAGGVVSTLKDEAILYYCLFDMQYGDDTPNPHCPFNSSLAPPMTTNAFNILSMASRKTIIAPYAYVAEPPYNAALVGTTYYAMGMGVSNITGPYPDVIDAAIAVRGPPMSYFTGPTKVADAATPLTYPDFIMYTGEFYCVNTANFLAVSNRSVGGVAFMAQAFEAHRAMSTANPDALIATQTDEQVSLFTFPKDVVAAYTAASVSAQIAEYLLAATLPSGSTISPTVSKTQIATSSELDTTTITAQSTTQATSPSILTPSTSDSPTTTAVVSTTHPSSSADSTTTTTAESTTQATSPSMLSPSTSDSPTTTTTTTSEGLTTATSITSTTTVSLTPSTAVTTIEPSGSSTSVMTSVDTTGMSTDASTTSRYATPPTTTAMPPAQSVVFDTDLSEQLFVQTIQIAIPYGSPMQLMWCKNSTVNSSRSTCEVSFWNASVSESVIHAANDHQLDGIYSAAAAVNPNPPGSPGGDSDGSQTTGIIIGIIVGALVLFVGVGAGVYFNKKRRSTHDSSQLMEPMGELNSDITIFS